MLSPPSVRVIVFLVCGPSFAAAQGTPMPPPNDPTALTQAQLFREIQNLKTNFDQQLAAIIKTSDDLLKFPTVMDQKLNQQKELEAALSRIQETRNDERFSSVDKQFKERDERAIQLALSAKAAIDTQNANNAALFTELKGSFAASIKSLQDNQATEIKSLTTQVSLIKDAQTASDSRAQGIGSSWGVLVGAIGMIVGLGALFVVLFRKPEKEVIYVPPTTAPIHTA